MGPKLKSLLARVILIGGVAGLAAFMANHVPHKQSLVIRLGSRDIKRIEGAVTRVGDDEPTAGFSQVFSGNSPRSVRHEFEAATGTYIVVINIEEASSNSAGDRSPNLTETSFERQVSLVGGEVIVSPD
ncbi:MAG TPA: hypothetical protein VEQ58_16010 [Polyangiaceae bacterium]|nr:hypothetical protein [Polyangiaceae bacterium]